MRVIPLLDLIRQHLNEYYQYNSGHVMQVLHKYTLRKLYDLLDDITQRNKHDPENFYVQRQLRYFLEDFYAVVKDTDALPLHNPNSSISKIMMHVATMLEELSTFRSRFEFLFPSLQVNNYVVSGTLLRDSALKLSDFVMNDDNTCLIEVLNCLKFASEDGILRHTCLFDDKVKKLSHNEKQRVINHSKESKEYWQAIQDKIQITLNGNSFGAVLTRLANDLYNGGVKGKRDGDELNSGVNANVGILNFFLWYDKLTDEDRHYLDEKRVGPTCLKDLIQRLKRPEHADYSETRYCVNIISGDIKFILRKNPDLYNKYPQNTEAEELRIEIATTAVANAEYRLTEALKKPNHRVTATYYGSKRSTLLFDNLSSLRDLKDYVGKKSLEEMRMQNQVKAVNLITKKRAAIFEPEPEHRVRRQRTRYTAS